MRLRFYLSVLPLLLGLVPPPASAAVGVSVGISVPGVQIGINVPAYPELLPVPAYPVYYAPGLPANYFFYDGLYWVYANDTWYSSSWYNGPWYLVEPAVVPVYVLRVPVRYYRVPPPYFRGWAVAEPPRWGAHWGPQWEARHRGWDRWDRQVPAPAPLPVYQRQYAGDRYPMGERQHAIRQQQYHFEPRDAQVRERLAAEARHDAQRDRRGAAAAGPTQAEQRPPPQQQPREERERAAQQQQQEQRAREQQAREQQARQRQQVQEREPQQVRQQQQRHERPQQQAREQQQQKQAERHAAERARAQKQPRPPERGESPRDGNGGG